MEQTLEFAGIDDIVAFAIQREQQAQETYLAYAQRTDRRAFSELLLTMARMEQQHERKLVELRSGAPVEKLFRPLEGSDQKLDERLVEVPFSPDMEYADFLILIIQKEGEAEKLYRRLAALARESQAVALFGLLAEEERKHKVWAQDQYDRDIATEN
jgi:rubrerythrin